MPDSINISLDCAREIAHRLLDCQAFDSAEVLYRTILDAYPDDITVLHCYSILCYQQHRPVEAVTLISRIIERSPENSDAYNNLGNVYESLQRYDDAEECYRKAISINSDHAFALNNLGVLLSARGDSGQAVDVQVRATSRMPGASIFHYNLGNSLRRSHRYNEAILAYQNAVSCDPDHFDSYHGLARTFLLQGHQDRAVVVFETYLHTHPDDTSAQFLLSACGGTDVPPKAPEAYVRHVFDHMANQFDSHMERLEYQVPRLLDESLSSLLSVPKGRFRILDAGCGTGLCGPFLLKYSSHLTGVDLSRGMLDKARLRNVYDELIIADLTGFMMLHPSVFDVVIAADTFCYFADLIDVFHAVATTLQKEGHFAFTLESSGSSEKSYQLNTTGRYSHSKKYVTDSLSAAGFSVMQLLDVQLRYEANQSVAGFLVIAINQQ